MRGRVVGGAGLRKFFRERREPPVFLLINRVGLGHEEPKQIIGIDVVRADPQIVHRRGQFRRPVGAGGRRGPLRRILPGLRILHVAKHIGDDAAGMVLLAVGGEPAHDVAPQATLSEDLPERAALSRGCRDGDDGTGAGIHLRESRHAVMVGHLARGDARPEHRRELRFERCQVAARARFHKPGQTRQFTGIEQRMDDLPVGRIPADEKQFLPTRGHRSGRHGGCHRRRCPLPSPLLEHRHRTHHERQGAREAAGIDLGDTCGGAGVAGLDRHAGR